MKSYDLIYRETLKYFPFLVNRSSPLISKPFFAKGEKLGHNTPLGSRAQTDLPSEIAIPGVTALRCLSADTFDQVLLGEEYRIVAPR